MPQPIASIKVQKLDNGYLVTPGTQRAHVCEGLSTKKLAELIAKLFNVKEEGITKDRDPRRTTAAPCDSAASPAYEVSWADAYFPQPINEMHTRDLVAVRHAFAALATTLQAILPPSKYKGQVHTKLEVVAMIATKCFSHSY